MQELYSLWVKLVASMEAAFRFDSILIYVPLVLVLALIIECICVGYRHSRLANFSKISKTDWTLYLAQQFNLSIYLGYAATIGISYFLFHNLHALTTDLIPIEFRVTSAMGYLLATDCMGYWYHRLSHRVPTLWQLHHVHHSARDFNIVAAFRVHPVESVVSRIFVAIPLAMVFIPEVSSVSAAVFGYIVLNKLLSMLQHSKINTDLSWVGKIFVSPAHHRIHHSSDPNHFDKNFGNLFIFWDKLFGTYCTASKEEIDSIKIGLADYDRNTGVFAYLWSTYWQFVRGIFSPALNGFSPSSASSTVMNAVITPPLKEAGETSKIKP